MKRKKETFLDRKSRKMNLKIFHAVMFIIGVHVASAGKNRLSLAEQLAAVR